MDWIYAPWPWYVAGPLIALTMFALLLIGKQFGMSSNLRTCCAAVGGDKIADFFNFNWKKDRWNLMVAVGAIVGGYLAANYMSTNTVAINPSIATELSQKYQISGAGTAYLPSELFANERFFEWKSVVTLLLGGVLIGFGARYAGGCTSGHAISGLSNLQLPSLLAVIGFFIGGMTMVYFLFPLIF
ncbi:YeeE/YedE family protein [Altibacter sp. HG106]|uniref:YeeE/YedE family protein n=1 Tax=Altibacter sp. HG106 TaxID=3023937 RepID=UPI002350226C|nr:YeeE/YedE thiosulfate transporter family protein [Altibacter sp. HG106]MDC7995494.1 YeeE/YedE thiosulfate transporter family protein [Altibacter sp. HG106]